MSSPSKLLECLHEGKPYFGSEMKARQGDPVRHAFMDRLMKVECDNLIQPFSILEIGSWAGGSAITWAEAIKKYNGGKGSVLCVDMWEPYHTNQQNTESEHYFVMSSVLATGQIFQLFLHNIKSSGNSQIIRFLKCPSEEALQILRPGCFDLIFVDGDHSYDVMVKDLRGTIPLLKEGGLLCGDDLELPARMVDKDFLWKNRNEDYVKDPKTGQSYHPGVTLAIDREIIGGITIYNGFWVGRKKGSGFEAMPPDYMSMDNLVIPKHLTVDT